LTGFKQQLEWIAEAGGTKRDDLSLGLRVPFGALAGPGESTQAVAERIGGGIGMTADEVLESPFMLVGDLARMKDHLVGLQELYGISYVTLSEDLAWEIAPLVAGLSH
jgi:hypothetical protein